MAVKKEKGSQTKRHQDGSDQEETYSSWEIKPSAAAVTTAAASCEATIRKFTVEA